MTRPPTNRIRSLLTDICFFGQTSFSTSRKKFQIQGQTDYLPTWEIIVQFIMRHSHNMIMFIKPSGTINSTYVPIYYYEIIYILLIQALKPEPSKRLYFELWIKLTTTVWNRIFFISNNIFEHSFFYTHIFCNYRYNTISKWLYILFCTQPLVSLE